MYRVAAGVPSGRRARTPKYRMSPSDAPTERRRMTEVQVPTGAGSARAAHLEDVPADGKLGIVL